MEKMYKLNKEAYKGANTVRVSVDYDKKNGGYVIKTELVEIDSTLPSGCFGKCFCKEYYDHDGDGICLVVQAGRRSAKRQAEAEEIFKRDIDMYAEEFLKYVNAKLGTDVCIAN